MAVKCSYVTRSNASLSNNSEKQNNSKQLSTSLTAELINKMKVKFYIRESNATIEEQKEFKVGQGNNKMVTTRMGCKIRLFQ